MALENVARLVKLKAPIALGQKSFADQGLPRVGKGYESPPSGGGSLLFEAKLEHLGPRVEKRTNSVHYLP